MRVSLDELVEDFADGLKAADVTAPQTKSYRPGIGPCSEAGAIALALKEMQRKRPQAYLAAQLGARYPGSQQTCDLRLPGEWVAEVKLARPFGDNGKEAEHWSENLLHPYKGNVSAVGDCLKLISSGFAERKAVIVYGFEHSPPMIQIDTAVRAFELIVKMLSMPISPRSSQTRVGLIHPVHQQLVVFGWELT